MQFDGCRVGADDVSRRDHEANGFVEVGVRELKAQMRILRSQLEQRFGSRIDAQDIRRQAAICVSRYRIIDGR